MKKYLIVFLCGILAMNSYGQQQCDNSAGASAIYTKTATYNCHQYVRAALLGGYVNLSTGIPNYNTESNYGSYGNQNIRDDQNFIRVCYTSDATAVVPTGIGADHSAIKMTNGIFASTPNGGSQQIYSHQNPRTFTSSCPGEEEYFTAIPNVSVQGPSAVNQGYQATFTLSNGGNAIPSYIQLSTSNWTFNSTYFTEVSRTSTSITLTAKTTTGTSDVTYAISSGCNAPIARFRSRSVSVMPNCTGTLDGGSLNTFNTVGSGTHQIVMYLSSWTWVKTSGTASYSTWNGGKNMSFSISSGCSSFNAYNSSCNLTFTFCRSSSLMASSLPKKSYTVIDVTASKVVKEGFVEESESNERQFLEGLPAGFYVVDIEGTRKKYIKKE